MKKNLFFAALAITALVSCSENDYLGDERPSPVSRDEVAIGFGSGLRAITRADVTGEYAADSLGKNFVVYGVKSDGVPFGTESQACDTVFDHYNVNWVANTANTTTSNTANWEYVGQTKHTYGPAGDQTIKYWDYAKSQYDFIAYSLGKATTGLTVTEINVKKAKGEKDANNKIIDGAYKITGTATDLAKAYIADLVTVYRDDASGDGKGNYGKEVDIKFRSLSAKVRIGLYEIVPGYSVKDVVFYSADATKDETNHKAYLYTTGTDVFNSKGTYIVYFPTTGSANKNETDYNKAHLAFNADQTAGTDTKMDFGTIDAATLVKKEKEETSSEDLLYIGRASNEASYAGINTTAGKENHYTVVIPNETGAVLNLKVDYTLMSTDGSLETIKVTGATARVPKEYATWKSGYAYTYLFKISQNSNGKTNPSIGPAGLYPITLDAVVVNSEEDGVQETITTVSEPSITTYAKGTIVTENNEYTSGSKIYVIVNEEQSNNTFANATLSTDNAALYTVTLASSGEDGAAAAAAQTINESSIANAFVNGAKDNNENPTTWTVKDANKWNLTLTKSSLTIGDVIAAADSPTGSEITIGTNQVANFTAGAAGTIYAFQYLVSAAVAESFTALTEVTVGTTDVTGKYERTGTEGNYSYTLTQDTVAQEGKTYGTYTPAVPAKYQYKIIRIQSAAAPDPEP